MNMLSEHENSHSRIHSNLHISIYAFIPVHIRKLFTNFKAGEKKQKKKTDKINQCKFRLITLSEPTRA
jgi:hypothetical protein